MLSLSHINHLQLTQMNQRNIGRMCKQLLQEYPHLVKVFGTYIRLGLYLMSLKEQSRSHVEYKLDTESESESK